MRDFTSDYYVVESLSDIAGGTSVYAVGKRLPLPAQVSISVSDNATLSGDVYSANENITLTANAEDYLNGLTGTWYDSSNEQQGSGAFDTTLTYQWYRDGLPISGATGATYTIDATTEAGDYKVRVTMTGTLNGTTVPASAEVASTAVRVRRDPTPPGVTVSGQVKSYNPKNATTIKLMKEGVEQYTTTIAVTTGSSQQTQGFSISGVAAGTYDLVVTKPGHLTYTITDVKVEGTDLNLTTKTGKPYSTITLLVGDMDNSGGIDGADLNIVWSATNFNKTYDGAANKLTDIDGSGGIDGADLNIVWSAANFNKGISDCTVGF